MGAPSIGSSTSNGTAVGTTHTLNLPTGIVAGNVLLAIIGGGNVTFTFPAGWSKFAELTGMAFAWRLADGTEGASISVTSSASAAMACLCYRLTGAHAVSVGEGSISAVVSTATPDPPSVTPSWGAADVLWFAVARRATNTTPTAFPTNYTLGQLSQADGTPTGNISVGARQLTAATEDPGTFTYAAAANTEAGTAAIRGSISLPPVSNPIPPLPLLVR